MHLKEPLHLEGKPNTIRLEAVEEFINVACLLEEALNKISDIIERPELNKSLESGRKTEAVKAFLDIKNIIKNLS